ncbi:MULTISPECIES: hypothetical protein [Nitrosomonas]|uniref:Avidin family protein n=1 Tax=Nitrosomonas communis TaxID=44574 RepID=A0A0F7KFP7_9PROT|nr:MULTISPECIES: hypothetical protein [Nitrosomonas]AKH37968.1 hypothetical protein AAW31_09290 [Nitrosomonas communis]TYP77422.1 hypothetical protein BCL69_10807 [Nitrosomonas communis]UVS59839.1 hypothetical protein NX761_09765 [Nitrosomonas sp. PLL12]
MSTDFTNWQIFQSNEDVLIIHSTLNGDQLTGTVVTDDEELVGQLNGSVTGTGFGSIADFKIFWDDGSVGSYLGTLDHDIRLVGITFSVDDPVTQETFVSS